MSAPHHWSDRVPVAVLHGLIVFVLGIILLRVPFIFAGLTDNYPPLEPELRPYANAAGTAVLISALALGILVGVRSLRRRPENPVPKGHCRCGYDLTGNTSGQCPECGAAVPANSVASAPSCSNKQEETEGTERS